MTRDIIVSLGVIAALPAAALAQTPSEAFECRLPYRASLEAAATLPILSQAETPAETAFGMHIPASSTVTFDPADLRVLGVRPTEAFLNMDEPGRGSEEATVTLTAYLPASPVMTQTLRDFIPDCLMDTRVGCHGPTVPGRGQISANPQDQSIWVECEFKVRPEDVG